MKKTEDLLRKFIRMNLHNRYSGLLSLSEISLLLIDSKGVLVHEFIPSPDYCTYVCRMKRKTVCKDYFLHVQENVQGRFICRYGLENILLPIEVEEEVAGYIIGIQAYTKEQEFKKYMIPTSALAEEKNMDAQFVAKSISTLKTVDSSKIETHEHLCRHLVKNIAYDLADMTQGSNPTIKKLSIEKEILEKKIIDLEAKNMSLVINPHFLFNTLNCIARIAYFEHSHTTEELIYCLSDLLRYNLKQDGLMHTIASEIDNIEKYLYIQKVRFKNRLDYEINISDQIKSYRTPNMVIQPIVENALIHGITPKRDGGQIKITAEKYKDDIIISVMDNGNGFSKEVLENIFDPDYKKGVGFRSTNSRLKRYFGEKYGLEIAKSDCTGCVVIIKLSTQPIVR